MEEAIELRGLGDIETITSHWHETVTEFADRHGFLLDSRSPEFREHVRAFNDTVIKASEAILRRISGQEVPTPPDPEQPAPEAAGTLSVLPLFDAYATATGITPGVRYEWRMTMERLVAFLRHDNVRAIKPEDIRRWRDALLNEETNRGRPRSAQTVRGNYIRPLSAMLAYAVDEQLIPSNPAAVVKVKVPTKVKSRPAYFSTEEAQRILTASLLRPAGALSEAYVRARRWVPWLCAYSGARVNEISQMRAEDIQVVDGLWTMKITPEAGTVKTRRFRVIPIHEHVITQGLVDMVKTVGHGPMFYDPSRRRVDKAGNRHFKKVGERLAKWVREEVGISDPDLQPNHAWRHTFKTRAAALGIHERVSDAITGHAAKTVGQRYTHVELETMAAAIAKFPRFDVGAD